MFCTCTRSCARADDAKIVHSRDAQCNTKESPLVSEVCSSRVLVPAALLHTLSYLNHLRYSCKPVLTLQNSRILM